MILCVYVVEETAESDTRVRFVSQGKCPGVMGEVIEYNKVIFITGKTNNRRGPQITMNKLKCSSSTRVRCGKGEASVPA
jgi:hypothetical protein